MADHSKPLTTSTYANFVTELDARLDDLTLALDPAVTSPTSLPTNAVRFSSASSKWQKWNGTVWGDLAATYAIAITGNAGTVTNGVVSTGAYSDPGWITSLAGTKISGNITGNAGTATTLATARNINGVAFDGSANIAVNTTQNVTFNNGGSGSSSGVTFNGSTATTISYNTVGAPSTTGSGASGTWAISISGNAATATNGVVSTGAYSDPGWITSLAGTKISGNITGNAASATNATNLVTAGFTVQQSGSDLVFFFGATRIAKLTSAGVFSAIEVASNSTI